MKAVILAGGLGTRLAEETGTKPKPMVEIGGRPILWHIMKIYSSQGINDFIICLGYKGYVIKEYFANYALHMSDVTIDMRKGVTTVHQNKAEPWSVTLIDTGESTQIGGRIKRVIPFIEEDTFCITYGDGLGNIDVNEVISRHRKDGRLATVTGAPPPGRFGALRYEGNKVLAFQEKPEGDGGWINAGFFVVNTKVAEYIEGDKTVWEREPLERLAADNQLSVHFHHGFWQPMDTLRDRQQLEEMWVKGVAPWKTW
jgi:glucose-1-phosphate cytidylyltransferase